MVLYIVLMIPVVILSIWASMRVNGNFRKYSKYPSSTGHTGRSAAREILDRNGLDHVRIEEVSGFMTDHYDPSTNVLRLSREVYGVPSLAAIGVAAHEAGHAIQKAKNYGPLSLRQALVPITQISAWGFNILILVGLFGSVFFHSYGLIKIAVVLLGVTAFFSLITLPVEFDASKRAKKLLVNYGLISREEHVYVSEVLGAAAMTYVAAAASTVMTLIYFVIGFGSRD